MIPWNLGDRQTLILFQIKGNRSHPLDFLSSSPLNQRLSRFSGYIWFLWVEKTLSNLSDRLMIIDNHRPSRNPWGRFRSTYLEFVLNWWNRFLNEDALKHTLIFYSLLRNVTHQKLSCPPISAVMLVLWTWRHRAWKFIRCYSYSI